MKCPKCGLEQSQAPECRGCGIIIAKYLDHQKNPQKNQAKRRRLQRGKRASKSATRYGFLQLERELSDYYQSQAAMLKAGLTAETATNNFLAEPGKIKDLTPYRRIAASIEGGRSIAEGMRASPEYFPADEVRLIEAGEQTGDPQAMFHQLKLMVDQRIETIETIRRELRKPRNTLLGSVFILPAPVLFSDGLSAYLMKSLLPLILILAIAYGLYKVLSHLIATTPLGETVSENLIALKVYRLYHVNRFLRVFTRLYAAGVTTADAWQTAADTVSNSFLHKVLSSHQPMLATGTSITEVARETGAFERDLLQVMSTGEASGSLDTALDRYVVAADEQFNLLLKSFASRVTMVIGALVSAYVIYQIVSRFMGMIPD